jgi:uncharacterized protein YndB with AHSA1/START domain
MTEAVDSGLVVRSSVTVALPRREAFRLFTERVATWWPLESHSVFGDEATGLQLEPHVGGRFYETTDDGRTSEWGAVTEWQPDERLALTWYPGQSPEHATQLSISFHEVSGGTRLDLVHTGWDARGADALKIAKNYQVGWEIVLGRYIAAA